MFDNQLAMLSLLLVGLSLSINLSEAVPNLPTLQQLLQMIHQAKEPQHILNLFRLMGEDYKIFVDLADANKDNCTPERIHFDTRNLDRMFGESAANYVKSAVSLQRRICEDTFTERLWDQYHNLQDGWPGKKYFDEFVRFVNPWPTFETETHDIVQHIRANLETYTNWRYNRRPSRDPTEISDQVIENSIRIHQILHGFLASLRQRSNFRPNLTPELERTIALGKIAEAVMDVSGMITPWVPIQEPS